MLDDEASDVASFYDLLKGRVSTQGHIISLDWHFRTQRQGRLQSSSHKSTVSGYEAGSTKRCAGNCDVACGRVSGSSLLQDCPGCIVLLYLPLNIRIVNFVMQRGCAQIFPFHQSS